MTKPLPKKRNRESHWRSLTKALVWRAMGTLVTVVIALIISGQMEFAAKMGLADTLFKIVAFYAYERLWNAIPFGRAQPPEYEI